MNVTQAPVEFDDKGETTVFNKVVSDYITDIITIVQYGVISSLVNVFGITSNSINIIIFIKQGFDETINISLLGLAVSDICSLLTLQFLNLCFSPLVRYSDLPIKSMEFAYLTAGWPRMMFMRVTAWLTAFITFERCLCIAMPLKVKDIITPKRTVVIVVTTFILLIAAVTPTYYTTRIVWKFSPEKNMSVLGIGFTEDREIIDSVIFIINSVFLPTLAYIIVIICTVILSVKLSSTAKWREASVIKTDHVSRREKQIVKMVSLLSSIFIFCYLPNTIIFFWVAREPEFNIDGKYKNIFVVAFSYCFLLDSVNSSFNIILYYKMSSRYRTAFIKLFRLENYLNQ